MNFTNLEHFYALSKSGSIRETAEALMVSQQALSAEIQRLEKELDVKLLTRNRPAVMTPCGLRLAEFASEVLFMRQILDRDLAELSGQKREILISIPSSGCPPFLMDAMTMFASQEQDCRVRLEERADNASCNDIRRFDLNISDRRLHNDMEYIQIQAKNMGPVPETDQDRTRSNYFAVAVRQEVLQQTWQRSWSVQLKQLQETKNLSLLRDVPFIRSEKAFEAIDNLFHDSGFAPKIVASTDNIDTGLTLCVSGVGALIAPDGWILKKLGGSDCLDSLIIIRLDRVFPASDVFVSYEREKVLTAQEQAFVRCLCDACQNPGDKTEVQKEMP